MIRGPPSGVLARTAAAARLVAAPAEIELLGEPLLDEVVDRCMKGVQTAKLLALELCKRRVNSRIT
jgi:hypothetical protein